jgi:transposase
MPINRGSASGCARGRAQLRPAQGRGPGDRIESPYDIDARFRTKGGMGWTGYMAHLTETCDEDAPRLVVHADTTPANVHEATRTALIHAALAGKGLAPAEHLVDAGHVSAGHLIRARERYGIDLVGPGRPGTSWQSRTEGAFDSMDFTVAWERRVARCPEGHDSTRWREYQDKARGAYIRVRFSAGVCAACPSKARCTHGQEQGRQLRLHPREEHEALAAARVRQESKAGRRLYAQRQGVEGTISQAVRVFDLRQARYRGLAKTHLQQIATAAALNLDRLAAWLQGRPLAPTRISRLAALAA